MRKITAAIVAWALAVAIVFTAGLLNADGSAQAAALAAIDPSKTIEPAGSQLDLFNYRLTSSLDTGFDYQPMYANSGINRGHALKFTDGEQSAMQPFNRRASDGSLTQGIVQSRLDGDGWPALSTTVTGSGESLKYLFNTNYSGGLNKYAYPSVSGLFQMDATGRYSYDSGKNYASLIANDSTFDPNKDADGGNQVVLYSAPCTDAVYGGQFLPFNSAAGLSSSAAGGCSVDIHTKGANTAQKIRHWFGMHLKVNFTQPDNGTVLSADGVYRPMTFEFSGNDDVWVFLDGHLVGDLGGIHAAAGLTIDFSAGKVSVTSGLGASNAKTTTSTISSLAGLQAPNYDSNGLMTNRDSAWDSDHTDTFADRSRHTLDVFYLNRGGRESSLKLSSNIMSSSRQFVAHKTLKRGSSDAVQPLHAGEFAFRLTGWYGRWDAERATTEDTSEPLMPTTGFEASNPTTSTCDSAAGICTATQTNTIDGMVMFGDAQFDAADLHRTYRYAIQELPVFDGKTVEDDDATTPGFQYQGITYDLDTRYFTASVEYRDYDSQDLMLDIVLCDKTWKPLAQQTGSIDIVNRSSPTVASAPLQGRLVLDNRKWRQGDRFLFSVNASGTTTSDGQTYQVEAPLPSNVVRASNGVGRFSIGTGGTGGIEPCTAAMNGTQNYCDFTFGSIGFSTPGTYTYTIAQAWENGTTVPDSGVTSANGITYSPAVYTVTYTVTETGAGTLAVSAPNITVKPGTSGDAVSADGRIVWTNCYQPTLSGDKAIGVSTKIIGRPWQSTDSFAYTLTALDGAPLPAGTPQGAASATLTVDNATKNHQTTFPDIAFPGAGTYQYVLTQNDPGMRAGLLRSAAAFRVTVTVSDNGDSTLVATMKLSRTADDEGDPTTGSGQEASGTVADFSNRFLRVAILPSAGGRGQAQTVNTAVCVAAALAAGATMLCAVSAIRRRCTRHARPPGPSGSAPWAGSAPESIAKREHN
ncbi:Spy0128 family protein [Bifidobacterium thermophilum]|uniref:Spy0128 family protein n=1 Tax=Bifidobacterium thermophilum TaxID=33905 RepID=UPI003096DAC0